MLEVLWNARWSPSTSAWTRRRSHYRSEMFPRASSLGKIVRTRDVAGETWWTKVDFGIVTVHIFGIMNSSVLPALSRTDELWASLCITGSESSIGFRICKYLNGILHATEDYRLINWKRQPSGSIQGSESTFGATALRIIGFCHNLYPCSCRIFFRTLVIVVLVSTNKNTIVTFQKRFFRHFTGRQKASTIETRQATVTTWIILTD